MPSRRIPDLRALELKGLEPSRDANLSMVDNLYKIAESTTIETANWYLQRRISPSRKSKFLRAAAAISIIIGAVLPLIHSVAPSLIQAEWGFVFLALGGGAVLFDRTFGFSASWTRYVRAGLALQRALANSQIDYVKIYVGINPDSPSSSDIASLIQVVTQLREATNAIVEDETVSWVGYLNESVEELTRSTTRSSPTSPQIKNDERELR
ncbi:SLATT domain-containing protein [Streptomyces mirabilis]|uniref:SLATT domain-containing protein n=1 Tax=Streptomyces mirabilis TaxID=68239 RepID=UPI003679B1A9